MNNTLTVTAALESNLGPHVATAAELRTVANVIAVINDTTTAMTLDRAEQLLQVTFTDAGWFVYRGGHHVSLHRIGGGDRVMLVAEREVRRRNRR